MPRGIMILLAILSFVCSPGLLGAAEPVVAEWEIPFLNSWTGVAAGYGNGITVINQDRGTGPHGPHVSDRVTVTGNTIRHLGVNGKTGANDGCRYDVTFDGNTYIARPLWFSFSQIHWCSAMTLEQFQEAGHEASGVAIVE